MELMASVRAPSCLALLVLVGAQGLTPDSRNLVYQNLFRVLIGVSDSSSADELEEVNGLAQSSASSARFKQIQLRDAAAKESPLDACDRLLSQSLRYGEGTRLSASRILHHLKC